MVATNRSNQDPYEDVLKQILAEIVDLRQKIEINANQRLLKYQHNYHSGFFLKAPVILRIILPCGNLICVIYKIAWLRQA